MAHKFIRGIDNIKEIDKQGLETNDQNDLLSDSEKVFVRNKDKYEPITSNVQNIDINDKGQLVITDSKGETKLLDLPSSNPEPVTIELEKIGSISTIVAGMDTLIYFVPNIIIDTYLNFQRTYERIDLNPSGNPTQKIKNGWYYGAMYHKNGANINFVKFEIMITDDEIGLMLNADAVIGDRVMTINNYGVPVMLAHSEYQLSMDTELG